MKKTSATILLAFVLVTESTLTWQHPTAQPSRITRDILFPGEYPKQPEPKIPVGIRVAGGENSDTPSGVAALWSGRPTSPKTQGTQSQSEAPPVIIPETINTRGSTPTIDWNKIAEIRRQNQQNRRPPVRVVGRPTIPGINDVRGNTISHSHIHSHRRPVRDGGSQSISHIHSLRFQPSLTSRIRTWPG